MTKYKYSPFDVSKAGFHDFDRSSLKFRLDEGVDSFTISVFQWGVSVDGKKLKRGKSKVSVRGLRVHRDMVHSKALEVLEALDAGTYTGPKSMFVRASI